MLLASGWPRGAYPLATTWPEGGLGVAYRHAIPPVPPNTAKSGPQPPKSAIESHLRFAESFRVHGPISMSESATLSTPPARNNSLRYNMRAFATPSCPHAADADSGSGSTLWLGPQAPRGWLGNRMKVTCGSQALPE